jgi:hypothetical protein
MRAVSQIIDEWQRERFLLGRLCRILQRLKPLVEKRLIVVSGLGLHDIGLHFNCRTEEDAVEIGKALNIDVKMQWIGHTAAKSAEYESDDLKFRFVLHTRRTVSFDECALSYAKRRNTSGWRRCKLLFHDYELTAHNFPNDARWTTNMQDKIKRQLWGLVKTYAAQGRFPNYDFVDPF